MKEKLKEKLGWEWKMFQSDMMSLSREDLFVMAEMIAAKKRIYDLLKEEDFFTKEEICSLLSKERMLDSIFMQLPKKDSCIEMDDIRQALK